MGDASDCAEQQPLRRVALVCQIWPKRARVLDEWSPAGAARRRTHIIFPHKITGGAGGGCSPKRGQCTSPLRTPEQRAAKRRKKFARHDTDIGVMAGA